LIDNCCACNLKCSMCDHENIKNYRKIQVMDFTLYTKLIDEIASEKPEARVWQIFFGDPFLCKDMPVRIAYAKTAGLQDVVLNSNGVLMTEEKAKSLVTAGLDAMYVGIDAVTPDVYNQIRIGGDFSQTVSNILKYRDLLVKYGNGRQKLYVQFVVSDINEHQVEKFSEFWKNEAVTVKIRPKVSWAGLVRADNLQQNNDATRRPCYWLMRTMSICADGRVALCAVDLHCRVVCGNAIGTSLKVLWSEALASYRQMHLLNHWQALPEMCRNCRDWQSGYAEFVNPQ
jgi:MoaA/NifB/PqqE/SkfB family radical SAM enzyme